MHLKRWLTAIIALPILVCLIGYGPEWIFYAVILAAAVIGLYEFYTTACPEMSKFVLWLSGSLSLLFFLISIYTRGYLKAQQIPSEPVFTGSMLLFLATIATAVSFHNFLHLPPVFGMMLGLAYLKFYGFYLRRKTHMSVDSTEMPPGSHEEHGFDVFDKIARAEWDTLLFFFGVIIWTVFRGARSTAANPWNQYADTLEWTLPSPPPEHTFETLPKREDWDKGHAH